MWFQNKQEERLKALRKDVRNREEAVSEREEKIEHQLELYRANRDHAETISSIARQDAKLVEDHKRRVDDLKKDAEKIEEDHKHRMALLKAEEVRVGDAIAAKEASNERELALWPKKMEAIVGAHEAILEAKEEVITSLKQQLDSTVKLLIEKLPSVDLKNITIMPGISNAVESSKK